MLELKKLSSKFTENNPDINLQWVIVEENILRQRVTTHDRCYDRKRTI